MAWEFEVEVPYELAPGVYANADRVWYCKRPPRKPGETPFDRLRGE
jgi:hypothetical protein